MWNEEDGPWGRICERSLLTYAHLLRVISHHANETWSGGVKYQADVTQNAFKKTYGVAASKHGFQKATYIAAINLLIEKGVCIYIFIYLFIFIFILLVFAVLCWQR